MMKGAWRVEKVQRYMVNEKYFDTLEEAHHELNRVAFECWYDDSFATADKTSGIQEDSDKLFNFIIDNMYQISEIIAKYKKESPAFTGDIIQEKSDLTCRVCNKVFEINTKDIPKIGGFFEHESGAISEVVFAQGIAGSVDSAWQAYCSKDCYTKHHYKGKYDKL